MDVSAAFRAAAAAHALERRFGSPDVVERLVATRALPPPSSRSPVLKNAHDALALVRELHGFVARNRGAYLEESDDADATRDNIETEVRLSVQACQAHVDMLKSTVQARAAGKQDTPQTIAHLHGVVLIVTERLAKVASAFDQCREVRFKRVLAEADRKRRRAPPASSLAKPPRANQTEANGSTMDFDDGFSGRSDDGNHETQRNQNQTRIALMTESDLIADELAGISDQVRRAEASVLEMSALSSLFASHVHTQAAQIETLYAQAIEATFHLKTGNVELRKTIERRSDAQRMIARLMFFATFALLFVDWISG
jgi:syntaxin 18